MNYLNVILFLVFCFSSTVLSFSWRTCGDPGDPIKVTALDINSTDNKILFVSGKGKVAINVTSPIQANLVMYKKIFWGWVKIPCVDQIGSCVYEDICSLSPYVNTSCPPEFVANQLPCKCPILQGQYTAKRLPVDLKLLPEWIESGRYKLQVTFKNENKELLCLLMSILL